jgi:hypothetical protein
LSNYGLFKLGSPQKAKLIDVSSNGAQIRASKKLKLNQKLSVNFEFSDGKKFALNAKIIRHENKINYYYELAFEKTNLAAKDKKASLVKVNLFGAGNPINAKYRNLTFDAVQILTAAILQDDSTLSLVFNFSDGEQLKTEAKIVCQRKFISHYYGIKFEKFNDELGDHLLTTQTDLFFG